MLGAIRSRGAPRWLLADNHGSFVGLDTRAVCARLNIHLRYARPYDGPAKGKIETFWRTLRAHVLDRLDLEKVQTLDDLNLRLSAWVEGEYNQRPHAAHGGRSPAQVWDEDADNVRWVEDFRALERAFTTVIERWVRNDSTCQISGETYEAPTHLRGQKIRIGRNLLQPEQYWVEDGAARVALHRVDAEANASRPRSKPPSDRTGPPKRKTGMNAVEDLLRRMTRPLDRKKPDLDDESQHEERKEDPDAA